MKKLLLLVLLLVSSPVFAASSTLSNLTSGGALQTGDLVYIVRSGTDYKAIYATATPQVNADWSSSSGLSQILNKPTLGTASTYNIGTSGSTVPLLNGVNVFSASNNFTGGLKSGGATVLTANQTITVNSDCTATGTTTLGVLCTKTNGVPFVASATTDTTNASNISSGTLPVARLPYATATTIGAVSVGSGLSVTATGVLSKNSIYGQNYYDGSTLLVTTTTAGNYYLVASTASASVLAGVANGVTQTVSLNNNSLTSQSAGVYDIRYNISYMTSGVNTVYHHHIFVDGVKRDEISSESKIAASGSIHSASANGFLALTATSVVDLRVTSDANGNVTTYSHVGLGMNKL